MKLAPEQFERILRALQGPPVGHDKRAAERFPLSTVVEFARPTDAPACCGNGKAPPARHWTRAISRDVCELGMGLITTEPADRGTRLFVRLPNGAGGTMLVACDVAHCQRVADGLVSLGLEFVEELDGADVPPAPAPPTTGAAKRAAPARRSKSCCGTRATAAR